MGRLLIISALFLVACDASSPMPGNAVSSESAIQPSAASMGSVLGKKRFVFQFPEGEAEISFTDDGISCIDERPGRSDQEDAGDWTCMKHFAVDHTYTIPSAGGLESLSILSEQDREAFLKANASSTAVDTSKQSMPNVLTRTFCEPGQRRIDGNDFKAETCVHYYRYTERDGRVVEGINGFKTHCFYPLPDGKFFAFIVRSHPLGSNSDACSEIQSFNWNPSR